MKKVASPRVNPEAAGARIAGHFGELVQGRLGAEGPVALITLPCPALVTEVRFRPGPGPLRADEAISAKTLAAARHALAELGVAEPCGVLTIRRPAAPGLGAGSSTAETLGAVRAVATAHGVRLPPETEARICLEAEGAVDPLMHDRPCLFASRQGRVLRQLPGLPAMLCVGGFAGPPRETDAGADDFAEMGATFGAAAEALAAGDLVALGKAATASAEANQARRPNPAFPALRAAAERLGAAGVALAHTGAAIALILPPDADERPARAALAEAGARDVIAWRLSGHPAGG